MTEKRPKSFEFQEIKPKYVQRAQAQKVVQNYLQQVIQIKKIQNSRKLRMVMLNAKDSEKSKDSVQEAKYKNKKKVRSIRRKERQDKVKERWFWKVQDAQESPYERKF